MVTGKGTPQIARRGVLNHRVLSLVLNDVVS